MVSEFNMLDVMGDQLIDFEDQGKDDPDAHNNAPEQQGEFTPHDELDCENRTPRGYVQAQDKQEDGNDRKDQEREVDRMDHELVGVHILPGHTAKSSDEASHKTDRSGAGHHGRNEKDHGKHRVVPERPGRNHAQKHTCIDPDSDGDGNAEPGWFFFLAVDEEGTPQSTGREKFLNEYSSLLPSQEVFSSAEVNNPAF